MGLDVYFHKVKRVRKSGKVAVASDKSVSDMIVEYSKIADSRAKDRVRKFAKRVISDLSKLSGDEYASYYFDVFTNKVKKYTDYEFKYREMLESVQPIDRVKEWFDKFVKSTYAESDAYFRKVNFIYRYFGNKLEDECCFVTKSDLEDLISRCDRVLSDHSLASELLPTTSGFFFGSTDYDKWYFDDVKDCKKQMKSLLKGYNEDTDVIYVVMSW